MKNAVIVYEQPLNELVRVMLRLENVFEALNFHLTGDAPWQSQQACFAIIDAIVILDRPDLKTKVMKELSRYRDILCHWSQGPQTDTHKLEKIIQQLDFFASNLHAATGKFAQRLRENDFLHTLRQHRYNPADTCNFDVPGFHHWCQQPASQRHTDLTCWHSEFKDISDITHLLLNLVRNCASPEPRQAMNGFYQEDLMPKAPLQLIRLAIPSSTMAYPEASIGRHRLSIRFHAPNYNKRSLQLPSILDFQLTRCVI